jgi:hypothetical protein
MGMFDHVWQKKSCFRSSIGVGPEIKASTGYDILFKLVEIEEIREIKVWRFGGCCHVTGFADVPILYN